MTETPFHIPIPPGLVETTFHRGFAAHQAGHLPDAETEYRLVLALDNKHFEALHMLGIVHAQRGMLQEATQLIQSALTIYPNHANALFNLGNMQRELGQYEAALASYDRTITLAPDHSGAHVNRGVALFELGRFLESLSGYDQALVFRPDSADIHTNRGNALSRLGRSDEALASYDRAIAIKPDYAEAYSNLGTLLVELGRPHAALSNYERAIELRPDDAQARFHRGVVFSALGQWDRAVASYDKAIALQPDYSGAQSNRGVALMRLGLVEEARANFERMIDLRPDNAGAHYNLGLAHFALQQFDDTLASLAQATALEPDFAGAHHNEALVRLLKGDFALGWEKFEWRWTHKDMVSKRRAFAQPLWLGDADLSGRTILLHSEQGLGDAIQFCRYVPMVAKKGAKVILEVSPLLKDLMQSLDGRATIIAFGDPLPDFEFHCPLMSLPLAFKTRLETIPAEVPYLSAHPDDVEKWRPRLLASSGPRIGLVWAGNPKLANDPQRSLSLQSMLPVVSSPGAQFFSLQKDLRKGDREVLQRNARIHALGPDLGTFADTAAVVSMLDLVISVDTSVAHLAGALGKPVWLLLPFVREWRWLLERDDSPWYPSARLFRQSRDGDWNGVLERVARELSRL
jgi:tetratricopeptide (TPR) repeat protein